MRPLYAVATVLAKHDHPNVGATAAPASFAAWARAASEAGDGRREPTALSATVSIFRAVYTWSHASSAATALGPPQ
jgi:hypothetical protein